MSPATNNQNINIFTMNKAGNKQATLEYTGQLPWNIVQKYCPAIERQIVEGGINDGGMKDPKGALFQGPGITQAAGRDIVDCLNSKVNEPKHKKSGITLRDLRTTTVDHLNDIYTTANAFEMDLDKSRGIRFALTQRLKEAVLSTAQFKKLYESLDFDEKLRTAMMNQQVKFSLDGVTKYPHIDAVYYYCIAKGIADDMAKMHADIKAFNEREERRQARQNGST